MMPSIHCCDWLDVSELVPEKSNTYRLNYQKIKDKFPTVAGDLNLAIVPSSIIYVDNYMLQCRESNRDEMYRANYGDSLIPHEIYEMFEFKPIDCYGRRYASKVLTRNTLIAFCSGPATDRFYFFTDENSTIVIDRMQPTSPIVMPHALVGRIWPTTVVCPVIDTVTILTSLSVDGDLDVLSVILHSVAENLAMPTDHDHATFCNVPSQFTQAIHDRMLKHVIRTFVRGHHFDVDLFKVVMEVPRCETRSEFTSRYCTRNDYSLKPGSGMYGKHYDAIPRDEHYMNEINRTIDYLLTVSRYMLSRSLEKK